MSDRIRLELTPASFTLLPGGPAASATVVVHNDSPIVDQLTLSLDGLEADWFSLSATSFNLFPGEHAELRLEVRAPTGALAAVRPFSVIATSRANPADSAAAAASLEVIQTAVAPEVVATLELAIEPPRQTVRGGGAGTFTLRASNHRNHDLSLQLLATDPAEQLELHVGPERLIVPAAGEASAQGDARARRRPLQGPPRTLEFAVIALPSDDLAAAPLAGVSGELVHRPLLPPVPFLANLPLALQRRAPLLLGGLAALALLIWFLAGSGLRTGGVPERTPPPSPAAAAASPAAAVPKPGAEPPADAAAASPTGPPPRITRFGLNRVDDVAPAFLPLAWTASNADSTTIEEKPSDPGAPNPIEHTEFVLHARNTAGEATQPFNLYVLRPPRIDDFAYEVSQVGGRVTLTYRTTGANQLLVNGQLVPGPSGSIEIAGVQSSFVLRAINAVGEASRELTLQGPGAPPPPSPTATATLVPARTSTLPAAPGLAQASSQTAPGQTTFVLSTPTQTPVPPGSTPPPLPQAIGPTPTPRTPVPTATMTRTAAPATLSPTRTPAPPPPATATLTATVARTPTVMPTPTDTPTDTPTATPEEPTVTPTRTPTVAPPPPTPTPTPTPEEPTATPTPQEPTAIPTPLVTSIPFVLTPTLPQDETRFGIDEGFRNIAAMDDIRPNWERIVMAWTDVQPDAPNQLNLGNTIGDPVIQAELKRGTRVAGLLQFTPGWAQSNKEMRERSPPVNLNLPFNDPNNYWGRFVFQTVKFYTGRIDEWVIWNEPEFHPGDAGAGGSFTWLGSDADFAQLLKVAYLAAKSANPNAVVSFPATSYWVDQNSNRPQFYERILDILQQDPDAAKNHYYHDVVSLNLYRTPDDILRVYGVFKDIQARHGIDTPVWLTETNAMPTDDKVIAPCDHAGDAIPTTMEEQAAYGIQSFAIGAAAGFNRVSFYKMVDGNPCNEPAVWGAVRDNGTRRPVADALRTAVANFVGFVRAQFVPLTRATQSWPTWPDDPSQYIPNWQVYQVALDKPEGRRVTLLWNGDGVQPGAPTPTTQTQAAGGLWVRIPKWGSAAHAIDKHGQPYPFFSQQGNFWVVYLPPATAHYVDDPAGYHFIGGDPVLILEDGVNPSAPVAPPELLSTAED